MEEVSYPGLSSKVHQLSHSHIMKSHQETTRVRIVLDASARAGDGPSLSYIMYPWS